VILEIEKSSRKRKAVGNLAKTLKKDKDLCEAITGNPRNLLNNQFPFTL